MAQFRGPTYLTRPESLRSATGRLLLQESCVMMIAFIGATATFGIDTRMPRKNGHAWTYPQHARKRLNLLRQKHSQRLLGPQQFLVLGMYQKIVSLRIASGKQHTLSKVQAACLAEWTASARMRQILTCQRRRAVASRLQKRLASHGKRKAHV